MYKRQADNDAVERAKQILERRINEMGLSEPLVQREGARRIIIELPGVKAVSYTHLAVV